MTVDVRTALAAAILAVVVIYAVLIAGMWLTLDPSRPAEVARRILVPLLAVGTFVVVVGWSVAWLF